jgi:hypothetical protein
MIVLLQIILWILLMYITSKVVNRRIDSVHSPFYVISNMLFDKGMQGPMNDIISGFITFVLFILLFATVSIYAIGSLALIDYVFLRLFGV